MLERMINDGQQFYWIEQEVREEFLRLGEIYGGVDERIKQHLDLFKAKPPRDKEFRGRLNAITSPDQLQELYSELMSYDHEWVMSEFSSWAQLVQVTYQKFHSIELLLTLFKKAHYPHSDYFSYNSKYFHLAMAVALKNTDTADDMKKYLEKESGHQGFLNAIKAAEVTGDRELGKRLFRSYHSFCDFIVN